VLGRLHYLVPAAASVLAGELRRVLRPGGALLRCFGAGGRDIDNLFAGLKLFDSVLLKSGVREILFRKPAES
jgi:hypothetical protein